MECDTMKRYLVDFNKIKRIANPSTITKEGLYYCLIDGKCKLCYYWKECDSLEKINPA